MNIIVVGGGKVGYYLTKTLLEHGHSPILIEQSRESCKRAANELDIPVICGDGTTIEVLEEAGISHCDALIGATGQDENNLIACQLAKMKFHVKKTVARVNNPKNVEVLKQLGVDIPISSTSSIARMLEREVDAATIRQLMSLNRGETTLSEVQLEDDHPLDGKRLMDLNLPRDAIIVTLARGDDIIVPNGSTRIHSGDKMLVVAKNTATHDLALALCLDPKDLKRG